MNIARILLAILALPFGIFMIIYGEGDDSPGAQFLGLLLVIFGIVRIAQFIKNR